MDRMVLSAIVAAVLDVCALVMMIVSYSERRSRRKHWSKVSADMELADQNRIYALECDEILIGRHASADIRLNDMSVSRYHAMLNVTDGKWIITDLDSKSGLFINGIRVQQIRLRENDVISMGGSRLVFRRKLKQR